MVARTLARCTLVLLVFGAMAVSACNTMSGMGRDISCAGKNMSCAAENNK
jgi:predicted small secreted protein